jgi:deoxyribodipyrimidine photo-lyase
MLANGSTKTGASLVWFRLDLRLADQPALAAALAAGGPVVPIFIRAPEEEKPWTPGGASRWWLHHALAGLDTQLRTRSSRLILRTGPSVKTLLALARETGACQVFWCKRYEPEIQRRDEKIAAALRAAGLAVQTFNGSLLFEPGEILNSAGQPFQVFGAFWRRCLAHERAKSCMVSLQSMGERSPMRWPKSLTLAKLGLLPRQKWDREFYAEWEPTQKGAQQRLRQFQKCALPHYKAGRDLPAIDGTSRLSPYLHFGQISPWQIWTALEKKGTDDAAAAKFLTEIGWREFGYHLLHYYPHTPAAPLRPEWKAFPWRKNVRLLRAWQQGRTGYPIVDAGMRQLWRTGWMHNRVRMIAASLLVKQLGQPWQAGAAWFWDTLVDADLASNTLGWQWVAGCGADAVPYFRIFNPVRQGERFDPEGAYVRRYIPELAPLPDKFIHSPWTAPSPVLQAVGIKLGKHYPLPIAEPEAGRRRALQTFEKWKAWRQ